MALASPTASSRREAGLRARSACSRARLGHTTQSRTPVTAARSRSSTRPGDGPRKDGSMSGRAVFDRLEHRNRTGRHDRRDCVLIDKLRVSIATQQDAEIIEPSNEALQFYSVDEKNRDRRLGLWAGI